MKEVADLVVVDALKFDQHFFGNQRLQHPLMGLVASEEALIGEQVRAMLKV